MKNTKQVCSILTVVTAVALTFSGCGLQDRAQNAVKDYNNTLSTYNEKIEEYNNAAQKIIDANTNLEKEISAAQKEIDDGAKPYDAQTETDLTAAISTAKKAEVKTPKLMPEYQKLTVDKNASSKDLKKLISKANEDKKTMEEASLPKVPDVPDYSIINTNFETAKKAFDNSVTSMKQITQPSAEFVTDRLKKIDTIVNTGTVTEDNDPNGHLNKAGGYTACVYFEDNRVNRSDLYLDDGTDPISVGTEGGGCIEVYANAEDAEARNEYLSNFDGGMLSNGSHTVLGTCVIRVSDELTATQQNDTTNAIAQALLSVDQ